MIYLYRWSNKYQAEVYLFGEDNGAIRDIAVNYTNSFDYMYTVGLFDTVSKTSQIQLCSVARFDGISFEKVR
ncbi:hypothetical protein EON65_14025 [archaeon]|nr:MAG: hypothetical protein EON65_14025 [archaeon]